MACFSIAWLVNFAVWAVIVAGIYAIVTLLLSKIPLGEPWPTAYQIIKIVMWVVVAIFIIYFVAELLECAISSGPSFPRVR